MFGHLQISFKLIMVIEITELYHLIPVWMTLTVIQGHSCMRNVLIVSQICQSVTIKFSMQPQGLGLLKLMLNLFHMISI